MPDGAHILVENAEGDCTVESVSCKKWLSLFGILHRFLGGKPNSPKVHYWKTDVLCYNSVLRARSSMVEHRTFNPLVESSSLSGLIQNRAIVRFFYSPCAADSRRW